MSRSLPAILLGSMLLAACGSDNSDDNAPTIADARAGAVIDSAESAAQAAAYLTMISDIDALADTRELDNDFRGKAARAVMKFRLEDNCPAGGDFSIFDDDNPEQLTLQFNNCANEDGEILDGRVFLQCQAGSFQDDSCTNVLITYGDGNGDFSFRDSRNLASLTGPWRVITRSTGLRVEESLEVLARDDDRELRAAVVTQNFFKDLEQDGNGGGLASIGGSAGAAFASPTVECATGLVTFTTRDPVQINSAGQLVGGRITVSNQAGASADVVFASDGTVTVTYNGATQTFPRSQFERFCEIDDS